MGKFSESRKNGNNIHISFYQIYLPKLPENTLKNYRLNLFKDIAIDFNHGLQTSSESLAILMLKFVNATVILAFSSSLALCRFLLVSWSAVPHT